MWYFWINLIPHSSQRKGFSPKKAMNRKWKAKWLTWLQWHVKICNWVHLFLTHRCGFSHVAEEGTSEWSAYHTGCSGRASHLECVYSKTNKASKLNHISNLKYTQWRFVRGLSDSYQCEWRRASVDGSWFWMQHYSEHRRDTWGSVCPVIHHHRCWESTSPKETQAYGHVVVFFFFKSNSCQQCEILTDIQAGPLPKKQ